MFNCTKSPREEDQITVFRLLRHQKDLLITVLAKEMNFEHFDPRFVYVAISQEYTFVVIGDRLLKNAKLSDEI